MEATGEPRLRHAASQASREWPPTTDSSPSIRIASDDEACCRMSAGAGKTANPRWALARPEWTVSPLRQIKRDSKREAQTMSQTSSSMPTPAALAYAVGIDIGMESCMMCCLTMEKRQVIRPSQFSNNAAGFEWLFAHLEALQVAPQQIVIGLEATSRYGENLYHALRSRGYHVWRLASRTDPRLCTTTRTACENGSVGCYDHRAGSSQWRSTLWICS